MTTKNNSTIPEPVIDEATQLINNVANLLKPYLIALTPAERKAVPNMSDKTQPFVDKTYYYTKSSPQFVPPFMDTEALEANLKIYNQLMPLFRLVKQLCNGLDDTTLQVGAESFTNALVFYNSVKLAARSDVPEAKTIWEDLKKRFAKSKSEGVKKEETDDLE